MHIAREYANVELPLNSLDPGSDYKNNDNFILDKDQCANTKEVLIQTEQAAKDATEESATQAATTDVSKSECNCRVQLIQATMWTQAKVAASHHQDTWQRALNVLCVLNRDCEKPTCPTVSRPDSPELPSTVSGEDCPTEAATTAAVIAAKDPEATGPCTSCTHVQYFEWENENIRPNECIEYPVKGSYPTRVTCTYQLSKNLASKNVECNKPNSIGRVESCYRAA